jgi:hypothetical protein
LIFASICRRAVNVPLLGEGDDLLDERLNRLGLGQGRLDLTVLEEPGCEIAQHGAAVSRGAIELLSARFGDAWW